MGPFLPPPRDAVKLWPNKILWFFHPGPPPSRLQRGRRKLLKLHPEGCHRSPEERTSLVTQAFSDIPENIRNMLLREGWSVCIKPEALDHRGSGTVIGQAIFADHRIELTAVSNQTAMVFLHEIGHIVKKKIRPELIRNGYTSRKALPDIVFHGGADTAYHEQLCGEYLANYLGESIYYRENAELAEKRFLSMYLQCIRAL